MATFVGLKLAVMYYKWSGFRGTSCAYQLIDHYNRVIFLWILCLKIPRSILKRFFFLKKNWIRSCYMFWLCFWWIACWDIDIMHVMMFDLWDLNQQENSLSISWSPGCCKRFDCLYRWEYSCILWNWLHVRYIYF
jgi:hypothetical protein